MNELELYGEKVFDDIKHIDENGLEYWEARELMPLLGYRKWENFHQVIKRAMIACEGSNNKISDHFPDVRKMVKIGSKTQGETIDYRLSRYACYLITQTESKLKRDNIYGENNASEAHYIIGKNIRKVIKKNRQTMPEEFCTI